jgi:hypothetical protein
VERRGGGQQLHVGRDREEFIDVAAEEHLSVLERNDIDACDGTF